MNRQQIIDAVNEWAALPYHNRGWLTRWARPFHLDGLNLFMQRKERKLPGYGRAERAIPPPPPPDPIKEMIIKKLETRGNKTPSQIAQETRDKGEK